MKALVLRARLIVVFIGLAQLNGCSGSFKALVDTVMSASEEVGNRAISTSDRSYIEHRIRWRGENLIRISWWYTGSGKNWRAIAAANPKMNVRRIGIGDIILVPEELVTRREAMPKGYKIPDLPSLAGSPGNKMTQPEKVHHTADHLDLFGPVEEMKGAAPLSGDDESLPLQTID